MSDRVDEGSRRWTIDRRISADTILSIGAVVAAVFGAYYGLRGEIMIVDAKVNHVSSRLDYEQSGDRRLFDDIRVTLRRIEDKLDGKADKTGR